MTTNNTEISVRVNGSEHSVRVPVRTHAADFLRHQLGLTGTHVGCEQGACGMCTIRVDGQAVKGCLILAVQLDGCTVETVECLSAGAVGDVDTRDADLRNHDRFHPLQERFSEAHALQCGFCTPGFLMVARGLEQAGRALSRDEIRAEIAGVLCRCTGYHGIVEAIHAHLASLYDAENGSEGRT